MPGRVPPGAWTAAKAPMGVDGDMLLVRRTRAVYAYRRTLWLLIVRDLKIRYAGSVLGYVWTVLDPLLMTFVYWFVFTQVFVRKSVGEDPYILFLVTGLLAWQWFNGTVTDTTRALVADSRLVRSTNIPREIWVLKTVGSKGMEFLFSLPVVGFFAVLYMKVPSRDIVFVPLAIVLEAVLLTGIGLALSAATVLVNDLQRVVRIALRVGFYFSPIVYSLSHIPEKHHLRRIMELNPLAGIIELYRSSFFPKQWAGWGATGIAAVLSFLILYGGLVVFSRLERAVLKEI
jgi:ABC-2 type transport system permease protein